MKAIEPWAELGAELVNASVPGEPARHALRLSPGSTIRDALSAAGLSDSAIATATVGVFGRRRDLHELVANGDRIELYRPLQADPKQARRSRVRRAQLPRGG